MKAKSNRQKIDLQKMDLIKRCQKNLKTNREANQLLLEKLRNTEVISEYMEIEKTLHLNNDLGKELKDILKQIKRKDFKGGN